MTMPHPAHPDPERLAALASADRDALDDRGLVTHVAACPLCAGEVRDFALLRAALAELPDLAPSRPLRLLPPVPEPAAPAGWRVAVRRAFAPLAVAGLAFILVGGLGAGGAFGTADPVGFLARFAPVPVAETDTLGPDAAPSDYAAPGVGGAVSSPGSEPFASPGQEEGRGEVTPPGETDTQGEPTALDETDGQRGVSSGWLVVVMTGGGLLVLAVVLRRVALPAR